MFFFQFTLFAQQRTNVTLENERREELIRRLNEKNIPFEERPLFTFFGGFGTSVHILIPSSVETESERTIEEFILAIPLSSEGEKENSNALTFGMELGLAFIEQIRYQQNSIHIRVAFLADEVSSLPPDERQNLHKGTRDLFSLLDKNESTLLLYIDIPDVPESLLIHHGTAGNMGSINVLKPFHNMCVSHKIPHSFAVRFNELYKTGIVKGHTVMQFAHERMLNAIYINKGENIFPQRDFNLNIESLSEMLSEYVKEIAMSQENLDHHFIIVPFFARYFFISELTTVIIFFTSMSIFLAVILVYITIFRRKLRTFWHIFIRFIWIFPLFIIAMISTLEISGSLISVITKQFEGTPILNDFGWAIFKIVIAFLLFSVSFSLLDLIKIPHKADFYGHSAVLFLTIGIFLESIVDITFIPLFIWMCLFIIIGAVQKKAVLVYVCVFCAIIPIFRPIWNILQLHNELYVNTTEFLLFSGDVNEVILSRNIFYSLFIAVTALPFLLVFERGITITRGVRKPPLLRKRIYPILIMLGISLIVLGFYTYRLSRNIPPKPERRTVYTENILEINISRTYFLERQTIMITLLALETPICFNLYLDSDDDTAPVIYSAQMPFMVTDDWKSIQFILGEGSPNPFITEITLPIDFKGFLRAEALYTTWNPLLDSLPYPESSDYLLRVINHKRL